MKLLNYQTIKLCLCLLPTLLHAQLSIERCQELVRANYPLIQRYGIVEQTAAYNVSNAGKGYLPQIVFNAKASYQSDVTTLPFQIPGIQIDGLTKEQFAAIFDISQSIWDGGMVRSQMEVAKAEGAVAQEQLNVDIYALEKRVNQLFFGILLWEAQLEQNQLLQDDLQRHFSMIEACVQNGIAHRADLDAVAVEQIRAKQLYQQLFAGRKAYMEMLSMMLGQSVEKWVSLEKPNLSTIPISNTINRPELKLFDAQNQLFETKKGSISASYMPRLHLFLQGGYGKPGLNMLDGTFSPFYVGGVRMTWNFGALYTQKSNRQKLGLAQQGNERLRETFLYHTQLEITQQNIHIERLQKMMQYDNDIIALRENIRRSAETKVSNGTLTVTELMRELNAENMAKQEKITHEIELLTAIYDLKFSTNNKP